MRLDRSWDLTKEEQREYGRRIRAGESHLRERLILSQMGLVVGSARKAAKQFEMIDDLVGVGCLVVTELAATYDPERGDFTTHCVRQVRGRMHDYLLEQGQDIRIPASSRRRHWDELPDSLVRGQYLEVDESLSIPDSWSIEIDRKLDVEMIVKRALSELSSRNRMIFELHLTGFNYSEIGSEFGISRTHVMRLMNRAYERLKADPAMVDYQ